MLLLYGLLGLGATKLNHVGDDSSRAAVDHAWGP